MNISLETIQSDWLNLKKELIKNMSSELEKNSLSCKSEDKGKPPLFKKGIEEKNGIIYDKGEPLAKFIFRMKQFQTYYYKNGNNKYYVRIAFIDKEETVEVDIPYDDLKKGKISKHIPPGFLQSKVFNRSIETMLCDSILGTIADLPKENFICLPFGYNIIKDRYVFNTGDRLINYSQLNHLIPKSDFFMKYSKPIPIQIYRNWISKFLESCNYPPVLLIAALVPYIFPLIDENKRVHYEFVVYIVGKSGCGKTEIAKLLVTPFTDNCNMISLSSDIDAIYDMSAFNDCSVLFDDLNVSDSDDIKRKKERTVAAIVETKQSVGKSIIDGKNTKINALPFITAEYILKREGFINRCLIVNIDDSFDPKNLTWLQKNHNIYISFINSFIDYICKNFKKLKYKVNKNLSNKNYMEDGKDTLRQPRISNIQFILAETLDILSEFIHLSKYTTGDFPSCYSTFVKSINECEEYTEELLKERSMDKEEHLIYELLSEIWDSQFGIVTNNETFFIEDIRNNPQSCPDRFVLYGKIKINHKKKNCFCFRGADAERYLEHKISDRTIIKKLNAMDLIRTNENTIPVFKKVGMHTRFICLEKNDIANYLGVDHDYSPPDVQDETDIGYNQNILNNSENYSDYIQIDLDETDHSYIEEQMCDDSDDNIPENERAMRHILESPMNKPKKHYKKF